MQSDVVEYPYALDAQQGSLVHVSDAPNGRKGGLICPDIECKATMVACQGEVREWYFRHEAAEGCRYLHDTTLLLLEQIINDAIDSQRPLQGQYTCECGRSTTINNLLVWNGKTVSEVIRNKQSVGDSRIRPDLNLVSSSKSLAFIEVVDTHPPEQPVIDAGFPVFEIQVSHSLLHELRAGKVNALTFNKCHNIPCAHIGRKVERHSIPGMREIAPEPEVGDTVDGPGLLPPPPLPSNPVDLIAGLNDAQTEAVMCTEGPLLIVAGPGSGKTRVVTHRIAYLVRECHVSPYRIAAVTFTNKAAREMRDRIQRLVGPEADATFSGTFHAFCARMLRRYGEGVGLDSNYTIYDSEDQLGLIKQSMELAEVDAKRNSPRSMQAIISRAKSLLMDSVGLARQAQAEGSYPEELAARVYHHYEELLARSNAVDFDDLLLRAVQLLQENREIREDYHRRYPYLMVDEFQDTNIAQYRLARLLTGPDRNICVVGDPDQSIYSWRNADIRNILSFQKDYPDARLIALEQNYRSTRTILDVAGSLIANNGMRVEKALTTEKAAGADVVVHEAYTPNEEAEFVVKQVLDLARRQRVKPGSCAVMYRMNAQSRALEEACLRQGVKYRIIGGVQFYRRREIKDLMAYLCVLHNPQDDVNLARAINTPPRGIGDKTIQDLTRWSVSRGLSVYEAIQVVAQAKAAGQPCPAPLAARAYTAVSRFGDLLARLGELTGKLPVSDLISLLVEEAGLEAHIRKSDANPEERMENIQEFISLAAEYESESPEDGLANLLERASLISDIDSYEESEDTLTLITLHQAKGLEFPVVFIVGLEEGLLPHSRSMDSNEELEEERRLCYVGITRAKERLYLLRAFQRGIWGPSTATLPSRFLDELPQSLLSYARKPGAATVAPSASRTTTRTTYDRSLTTWESPAEPPPGPEYVPAVGDTVKHDKFGEGVVMQCEGWGNDYEVSVCFDGGELRRLLLSLAGLEKVAS